MFIHFIYALLYCFYLCFVYATSSPTFIDKSEMMSLIMCAIVSFLV